MHLWSTHYGNLSCRRARALAQAAIREEARATRLEGALRDARRRLAAAIARLQNKRGTYNIRTALWNKRHAAKQARRKARLAERAGVAFKPRRRSARAAEGVAEGVAPLRRRHNWRRTAVEVVWAAREEEVEETWAAGEQEESARGVRRRLGLQRTGQGRQLDLRPPRRLVYYLYSITVVGDLKSVPPFYLEH